MVAYYKYKERTKEHQLQKNAFKMTPFQCSLKIDKTKVYCLGKIHR